jgi:hypothetical protein
MADERGAREMLLDVLLEKVAEDTYPSVAMLDLIETLLRPDEVPVYVAVLLRRIEQETYPSIPLLRRLTTFAE